MKMKDKFSRLIIGIICVVLVVPGITTADLTLYEATELLATDGFDEDEFGYSVCVSGDVAVVGSRYDDDYGDESGSAYIYRLVDGTWVEEDKLNPNDAAGGVLFGWSVSISGDLALVGSRYDNEAGEKSGSAYIFRFNGETWDEEAKLLATDGLPNDRFGWSVAIEGDTAIVGAENSDE